jgi:LuxR family maltose regulon positive regulatory protein
MRGEIRTLRGWLDKLPVELTRSRPQLGILYAWALAFGGDAEGVEPYLQSIDVQQLPGDVAAVRAHVAGLRDQTAEATEFAHEALNYLPESKWFSRGIAAVTLGMASTVSGEPGAAIQALTEAVRLNQAADRTFLTSIATTLLGQALQMQGRLHEAAEVHRQALQLASEQHRRPVPYAGLAHIGLSKLLYEWNDLQGAMYHAERGIELYRLGGLVEALPAAYFILAQVHLARGHPDRGAEMIRETAKVARKYRNDYVLARAAGLRMRLWMTYRDRVPAPHWTAQHLPGWDDGTDYLRELARLARARELMASALAAEPVQRNRVRSAVELLQRLLPAAKAAGRVENAIRILVPQALAFQMEGDADQALSALNQALSLAAPEGYVRIFVDEGEPMARLLRRALAEGIAPSYVSRLLAAFGESAQPVPRATKALVEPLTERELEVLRLIAAGLSNREIAQELVVAVSTVKSHINHIYGKLDAKSRIQAVAKARKLGLL